MPKHVSPRTRMLSLEMLPFLTGVILIKGEVSIGISSDFSLHTVLKLSNPVALQSQPKFDSVQFFSKICEPQT